MTRCALGGTGSDMKIRFEVPNKLEIIFGGGSAYFLNHKQINSQATYKII